uniref:Uncharacterized protein n=1 Tax=Citrobacter freundii TaxID=546 RepID=A0A2R4AJV2_CITFR|nr:hypothetical protein [Citrobacter freundii]WIW81965.1 hypothetical protein [Salmonella sp.]
MYYQPDSWTEAERPAVVKLVNDVNLASRYRDRNHLTE